MKRFSKLMVIAVMAVIVGCFASCKTGPGVVSRWKSSETSGGFLAEGVTESTLVFYDDNTFTLDAESDIEVIAAHMKIGLSLSGTYEGNADADGEVMLTVTSSRLNKYEIPDDILEFMGMTSEEAKKDMEESISEMKGEYKVVINGDTLTTDTEDLGSTYKRA